MINKKTTITVAFLFIAISIYTQNWKNIDKHERDSIKINRFLKNDYLVGLEPGVGLFGQNTELISFGYKIEPQFGRFVSDNMLVFANVVYSRSYTTYDSLNENWQDYLTGMHFRYYLPERNMKIRFFGQAGFFGGYLNRLKVVEHVSEDKSTWMLACSFKAGVSIPIRRRFNIEAGFWHNYQLFNYDIIDITDGDYFFSFSYTF